MKDVMRFDVADFLNTGTHAVPVWTLMGTGFNSLDENPSAVVTDKGYINNKNSSPKVTGYKNVFPFDTDIIIGEAAVEALLAVGRNQLTGTDAEFEYIRVDLYDGVADTARPARLFTVVAEIANMPGAAMDVMRVTGNLKQKGDLVQGTFNVTTKAFTPEA